MKLTSLDVPDVDTDEITWIGDVAEEVGWHPPGGPWRLPPRPGARHPPRP